VAPISWPLSPAFRLSKGEENRRSSRPTCYKMLQFPGFLSEYYWTQPVDLYEVKGVLPEKRGLCELDVSQLCQNGCASFGSVACSRKTLHSTPVLDDVTRVLADFSPTNPARTFQDSWSAQRPPGDRPPSRKAKRSTQGTSGLPAG